MRAYARMYLQKHWNTADLTRSWRLKASPWVDAHGRLGRRNGPRTDIPVSVIVPESTELALQDAYRQHGAQRAFILLSAKPESETLQLLDILSALTETYS